MNNLDITNYIILTAYIDRHEYSKALTFITQRIKNTSDDRIHHIHLYLLTELDYYEEAFKMLKYAKNVAPFYLPRIFKNMNLLDKLKGILRSCRERYELAVLKCNMEDAMENAKHMCDNERYLCFVYFYNAIMYNAIMECEMCVENGNEDSSKCVMSLDEKYRSDQHSIKKALSINNENILIESSVIDCEKDKTICKNISVSDKNKEQTDLKENHLNRNKISDNLINIEKIFKNEKFKVHAGVLIMGIERGIFSTDANKYLENVKGLDGDYKILLKEMLVRGYLNDASMGKILKKLNVSYCKDSKEPLLLDLFVNYLVVQVDDWKIYEYAIKNQIVIKESRSMNYLHYLCYINPSKNNIEQMLMKLISFDEINKIFKLAGDDFIPENGQMYILHKYLKSNTKTDITDIKKAYHHFYENKTLLGFKILIALLLSTKKERFILLAYKIAKSEQTHEVYIYRFIYMFIARFFCHANEFKLAYSKFEIKNVIVPKMYGVWNRLFSAIETKKISNYVQKDSNNNVITSDEFHNFFNEKHNKFKFSVIKSVNNSVIYFIDRGLYHTTIELLELKNKLLNPCYENKECFDNFVDMLGDKCKFIFSDRIYTNEFNGFVLPNLYSVNDKCEFSDELFKNEVENINCKEFRAYMKGMYE